MELLSQAIVAPVDFFVDPTRAKFLSLFFDKICTWELPRLSPPAPAEDMIRIRSELAYLSQKGVVTRLGAVMPMQIIFTTGEHLRGPEADLDVPIDLLPRLPAGFEHLHPTDKVIRQISQSIRHLDAPATAFFEPDILDLPQGQQCLEVTLSKVPLPPPNMPWDDFIQFRQDEENKNLIRKLRLWMHKQATNNEHPHIISEEIESLLHDYELHMKRHHKKNGEGFLSLLLVTIPDVVTHLMDFNFASAVKDMFSFREKHIALADAEASAPGREVAYIAKARDFISSAPR